MKNNVSTELLTHHFTLWELTRSGTAIRLRIENRPSPVHIRRLRALCTAVLEPLRARFGAIRVTSGYRCEALNRAVGGVETSQHLLGEAADIHVASRGEALRMMRFIADRLPFDQLILERSYRSGAGWIHVSYRSDGLPNRHQVIGL